MAAVKEYSVEEKLSSLVRLQKIDSKLDEIKILKGELPMEVSDLEDEIQGLHSRQTRIEEEINGITDFIEQKKNAIKDADALVKKYQKQSDAVKNNREYEAITKEIEMQELEVVSWLKSTFAMQMKNSLKKQKCLSKLKSLLQTKTLL